MSLSDFFNRTVEYKNKLIYESMDWMKDRSQVISQNIVKEMSSRTEKVSRWGHIYQFVYEAKTKSKLKYYDFFPMSIVLEKYKDGFLGINLHYLPLTMRFMFMEQLWKYVSTQTEDFDDDTRIILRYKMLKTISGKKYFRPCLKRYLYSHMKTPMYHIPANKWMYAMILPSSKFFNSQDNIIPNKLVYMDSRNDILNNK